jgi:hypothetical protein
MLEIDTPLWTMVPNKALSLSLSLSLSLVFDNAGNVGVGTDFPLSKRQWFSLLN